MRREARGMLLFDVIVGVALLSIVCTGLVGAFLLSSRSLAAAKGEGVAAAALGSQMELVRSLPYADIGVPGGSPSGVLAPLTETRNGVQYAVDTSVRYVDDPADGSGGADAQPDDYKAVTVRVVWPVEDGTASIAATSYVAPE